MSANILFVILAILGLVTGITFACVAAASKPSTQIEVRQDILSNTTERVLEIDTSVSVPFEEIYVFDKSAETTCYLFFEGEIAVCDKIVNVIDQNVLEFYDKKTHELKPPFVIVPPNTTFPAEALEHYRELAYKYQSNVAMGHPILNYTSPTFCIHPHYQLVNCLPTESWKKFV